MKGIKITYIAHHVKDLQWWIIWGWMGQDGLYNLQCATAKKMTSVRSMHYIGLEFIRPIWDDWPFWNMPQTSFPSLSKHMSVQAGTQSCIGNFCSSVWSHSFAVQSLSEKIYPSRWFLMPDTQKHSWKAAMIVVWLCAGYGISKLFPDWCLLMKF